MQPFAQYPNKDPLILLLNEIEILLAQIHLTELYIKQAQSTASRETERTRQEYQAELELLRAQLHQKDLTVAETQATVNGLRQTFRAELEALQRQLEENQAALHSRSLELERIESQRSALLGRITQLESAAMRSEQAANSKVERLRTEFETELAKLRTELEREASQQRETGIHELEQRLHDAMGDLRDQLAEKDALLENRDRELRAARSQVGLLLDNITQLEFINKQSQAAAKETERARQVQQSELETLRTELGKNELALQERQATIKTLEENLTAHNYDRRAQLTETEARLANREEEIKHLTAEADRQLKRIAQLESARTQIEEAASVQSQKIWESATSEVVGLRAQLKEKERALESQHEAVTELQKNLNASIQDLQNQLTEKHQLLADRDKELQRLEAERSSLLQRTTELESTAKLAQETLTNESRRLRDGFQVERVALRAELEQKERELQQHHSAISALEQQLQAEIRDLGNELAQKNALLEKRESVMTQLDALRGKIEERERAVKQRELRIEGLEGGLGGEVRELRGQLAETQMLLDSGRAELHHANSQLAALQQQLAWLDSAKKEAETSASIQAERMREAARAEVATVAAKLAEREEALSAAQASARELEDRLSATISAQHLKLKEKQLLLESRDVEISDIKAQVTSLLEQNVRLDSAGGEAERSRQRLESDLAELRTELEHKDRALQDRQTMFRKVEEDLTAHVHDFRSQLTEKQALLGSRDEEIGHLKIKTESLLERISQLEASKKRVEEAASVQTQLIREDAAVEIAALQDRLEKKQKDLQTPRESVAQLENSLNTTIHNLQTELAEKQQVLEAGRAELQQFQSESAWLRQRIAELESAGNEAAATAVDTQRTRQELRTEIDSLRSELGHKEQALHELQATFNELQENQRSQVQNLEAQVAEKHRVVEDRTEDLLKTKSDMDALLERLTLAESGKKYIEETTLIEIERIREGYQAELASVRAELSEKERMLQNYKAVGGQDEQRPAAPMQDREAGFGEKPISVDSRDWDFLLGEPSVATAQKEKYTKLQELVETIKSDPEQPHNASRGGRWRSIGQWKRRWKT